MKLDLHGYSVEKYSESYSEQSQIFTLELFAKMINGILFSQKVPAEMLDWVF